jgi:hypothetical protein
MEGDVDMNLRSIGMWAIALLLCEASLGQQVFIRSGDHVGRGVTRKKMLAAL